MAACSDQINSGYFILLGKPISEILYHLEMISQLIKERVKEQNKNKNKNDGANDTAYTKGKTIDGEWKAD